jgi:hypothetical protein
MERQTAVLPQCASWRWLDSGNIPRNFLNDMIEACVTVNGIRLALPRPKNDESRSMGAN